MTVEITRCQEAARLLISKLEPIPADRWTTVELKRDGKRCALGHLGASEDDPDDEYYKWKDPDSPVAKAVELLGQEKIWRANDRSPANPKRGVLTFLRKVAELRDNI